MSDSYIDSTMGLTAVSGLGALLSYFIPSYSAEGRSYDDVSALMTCTHLTPRFTSLANHNRSFSVHGHR